MECKYIGKTNTGKTHTELIDTLWNVNSWKTSAKLTLICELIDTLWNVNRIITVNVILDFEN